MSQNLITLLDFLQQCFSRDLDQQRLSQRRGNHGLAEAGHQTRLLAEAKHQATQQGKRLAQNFARHWFKNITRLLKRFHGFASLWSLLNQRTKRCCMCRDFTAARCDHRATKCVWLGRVSTTARVTLEITKYEIPLKSSGTRAETNRES